MGGKNLAEKERQGVGGSLLVVVEGEVAEREGGELDVSRKMPRRSCLGALRLRKNVQKSEEEYPSSLDLYCSVGPAFL